MVGRVAGGLAAVAVAVGLTLWLLGFDTLSDAGSEGAAPVDLYAADLRDATEATLEGRATPATASATTPDPARATLRGLVLLGNAPSTATVQVWRFENGWGRPHVNRRLSGLRPYGEPLTAGPDGRFELAVDVPGSYRLLARRGGVRGTATARVFHRPVPAPVVVTMAAGHERLAGAVVDGGGRPVRGRLCLRRVPEDDGIPVDALRRTAADVAGRFAFADLPTGRVTVGTELDGGALFWGPVVTLPSAEPYRLVVDPHARTLAVRVLDDATGDPLPGAEVLAYAMREVDRGRWTARDPIGGDQGRADEHGQVRLAVPQAPLLVVHASHEGHLDASADVAREATSATVRLARAGRLVGTVRQHETREPVAGVTVRAGERTDVTDASGRFAIGGLRGYHATTVSAWGPGLVPHGELRQSVEIRSGETTSIQLLVEPGIVVRGRVVTSDGEPVAGARVWLHHGRSYGVPREVLAGLQAATEGAGTFEIPGVPGTGHAADFEVCAKGPGRGMVRTPLERRVLMAGETPRRATDPLEIVLPDPRHLRVRAEDVQTGGPVPGVRIRADAFTEAVTGEDGWALLGPLAPGHHAFSAQASGWKMPDRGQPQQVFEIPEQGAGEAILRLQQTCRIGGHLVYADGTPADDRSFGIGVHGPSETFWTDCSRGRFHFDDLARDTYEVKIVLGGMEVAATVGDDDERIVGRATVAADQLDARIVLSMRRPTPLEILVLDGDGKPLPEAEVHFLTRTVDEEIQSGVWIVQPRRIGDGRLELSGLESPVWLTVEPLPGPGARWARKRVGPIDPGTPRVEVRLEPGHEIRGRVVDDEGEPVSRVPVSLWPDDTPQVFVDRSTPLAEAESAADGSFVFDRLPRGRHWLSCDVPDAFGGFRAIPVDAGAANAVLRLHRRRAFSITVLGSDGRPLPMAGIACHEPPWYSSTGREVRTGADGVAHVPGLDDRKRYTLTVSPPRGVQGHRRLTIHDWEPADDTLRLEATHVVRGRVVDEQGKPAVGARILAHTEDGLSHPASATDAQGRFEVHLPAPGSVLLEADDAGKRSETVTATPGDAEVRLVVRKLGGAIRIRLREWPEAKPPAQPWQRMRHLAWVWREDRPSWTDRALASVDGRIDVEGLDPTARYSVFYRHPDQRSLVVRLSGLVADGEPVTATPSPGVEWKGRVRLPEGVHFDNLAVAGTDVEVKDVEEDGSYVIRGLPRGPWAIHAWAWTRGLRVSARVEAHDGRVPDLVFDTR
jgi:protocatechuate 3,4-dioxygenase beta subunit